MPLNTGGGTTVSFNNTPQAGDDVFAVGEDLATGTLTFDVMANDKGGNAKSLWSVDNGQAMDLLAYDGARSEAASNDKSALGATIWITPDGKVGYSAASIAGLIQGLAAGQTIQDSFSTLR